MIKLNFSNETDVKISESIFKNAIALTEKHIPEITSPFSEHGEINIIIVDDKKIHEINRDYRKKDKPTDVISFAYLESEYIPNMQTVIGDIFISHETAERQAQEKSHSLEKEMAVLTTHGLLHLFGFDHQNDEQENEMEHFAKLIISEPELTKHF